MPWELTCISTSATLAIRCVGSRVFRAGARRRRQHLCRPIQLAAVGMRSMSASRLLLEHYFVEEVSVAAVLDDTPGCSDAPEPVTRRAYAVAPDDPHLFQVRLTVDIGRDSGAKSPYRIRLALRGIFRLHGSITEKKLRDALLSNTAPSILYGAARELVLGITGRGPHPPVLLPAEVFPPETLELGDPSGTSEVTEAAATEAAEAPVRRRRSRKQQVDKPSS